MRKLLIAAVVLIAGLGAWTLYPTFSVPKDADVQKGKKGGGAVFVVTTTPKISDVRQSFEALGTAAANEAITVTSKVSGVVAKINFIEGEFVEKGRVLVELENRELRATLNSAIADESAARDNYERSAQLLTTGNAPKATVQNLQTTLEGSRAKAEAARARLADLSIIAPFSGRLGLRRVSVGSLVTSGTAVTTLDDVSVMKLDFSVPEIMVSRLQPGAKINARSDAYPGREFEGVVKTVDSRVDPITRAVEVRAELPNSDGIIKPGMLFATTLTLDKRDGSILVPEEALVPIETSQYVFVMADNKAVQRKVQIGERLNGFVEIRSGIDASSRVIVGGLQKVRNGVEVRETPSGVAERN